MLKIRPAIAEDASALWEAEVETAKTPGRLVSRPNELLLDAFVQKIRELGPRGCYTVAVDGDEVLGHAFLEPMTLAAVQHVYRLTIVVHPGQTGRGVGTALLTHLQRWAAGAPAVGKIELLVRHTNTDAIRLYQRLGFTEEGRFKDRIRFPDGESVDDIATAWFPPTESG
jgi:ribosomal protein S18 acetylase RimI-like enzyme